MVKVQPVCGWGYLGKGGGGLVQPLSQHISGVLKQGDMGDSCMAEQWPWLQAGTQKWGRRLWWGFHEMHTVPSARACVSGSALRGDCDCMLPFYRGGD